MPFKSYMIGHVRQRLGNWQLRWISRKSPRIRPAPEYWCTSLKEPTEYYLECTRHFFNGLQPEIRGHRFYFYGEPGNRRGFGEHAFHVMWHQLLERFQPKNFLEIGVFRGQVICLVAYWAKLNKQPCEVVGISPFSTAGDSVSKYADGIDYYEDTLANFAHFQLPAPMLVRAYSTDEESLKVIRSRQWDLVYIDGNHDYAVAKADWEVCSSNLKPGGVVVLDDSGLTTAYQPPMFASRGHPGPSRVASEIDPKLFREILQVGHNRAFQKIA